MGGVLLSDGRVFCVPHNGTVAHLYGSRADTGLDMNLALAPYFNKL